MKMITMTSADGDWLDCGCDVLNHAERFAALTNSGFDVHVDLVEDETEEQSSECNQDQSHDHEGGLDCGRMS